MDEKVRDKSDRTLGRPRGSQGRSWGRPTGPDSDHTRSHSVSGGHLLCVTTFKVFKIQFYRDFIIP